MLKRLEKYTQLKKQAIEILDEIINENNIYIQENRKLLEGDIIEVYDLHEKTFVAKGVVGRCINGLHLSLKNDYNIKLLTEEQNFKKEKLEKLKTEMLYEAFALKKDGTASAKHLFEYPHFLKIEGSTGSMDDYFIKK